MVLFCFCSHASLAQHAGFWKGKLNLGVQQLELGFNVLVDNEAFLATLDVPAQGAYGVPVNEVAVFGDSIRLGMSSLNALYKGKLRFDTIEGTFTQQGMTLPLILVRSEKESKQTRSQDPKEPFGYHIEEVRFTNERHGVELAGTFTVPNGDGPFPAVVLVSGSGAQDRNEEVFNHRPFWVIADYLTRNGIAVLRYDDCGVGGSGGDPASATTLDFSFDAEAAFDFLGGRAEVDTSKIGILGHSEGGLINFMVAARRPDVAFVISLAGPAVPGIEVLRAQQEAVFRAQGLPEEAIAMREAMNDRLFAVIAESNNREEADSLLRNRAKEWGYNEEQVDQAISQLTMPWMYFFLKYDPTEAIVKTNCPALLLNGSKDLQVLASQNFPAYENSIAKYGKTNLTLRELPGLNHLFQHCQTGAPDEYFTIDETISPEVLEMVVEFVKRVGE